MKSVKKFLYLLFILYGFTSCNDHPAIGTWNHCNEYGVYGEYNITDKYVIIPALEVSDVWIFKNEIRDSVMIWSHYENGMKLMFNNDTIFTLRKSDNEIVLKSLKSWDTLELKIADFGYDPIDSTNLRVWKDKILSGAQKRESAFKCQKKPIPFGKLNLNEAINTEEFITEEQESYDKN